MSASGTSVVATLAAIGITASETVAGRIVVPELVGVPPERSADLAPEVVSINFALQEAGLLRSWRARTGGSIHEHWILIVRQ